MWNNPKIWFQTGLSTTWSVAGHLSFEQHLGPWTEDLMRHICLRHAAGFLQHSLLRVTIQCQAGRTVSQPKKNHSMACIAMSLVIFTHIYIYIFIYTGYNLFSVCQRTISQSLRQPPHISLKALRLVCKGDAPLSTPASRTTPATWRDCLPAQQV